MWRDRTGECAAVTIQWLVYQALLTLAGEQIISHYLLAPRSNYSDRQVGLGIASEEQVGGSQQLSSRSDWCSSSGRVGSTSRCPVSPCATTCAHSS